MGDWTVVRHKRGTAGRRNSGSNVAQHVVLPFSSKKSSSPADDHVRFYSRNSSALASDAVSERSADDREGEEGRLLGKMRRAIAKVEQSVFFSRFLKQMKDLEVVKKEEDWSGLNVYVNWTKGTTQAVVLATDVFGWDRPLLRKLADKVAAEGFVTAVPDFFKGDPMDANNLPAGPQIMEWMSKHPFESAVADTLATIKVLKEKGIKSIGVAGFCYGGKVGTLVSQDGVTDATVMLHPGRVTVDDIKARRGPLAILAAELDQTTTLAMVEDYKKVLESQNDIEYMVKVFPGTHHGWRVRYDENDEKSVTPAYESHADTIAWFKKQLK